MVSDGRAGHVDGRGAQPGQPEGGALILAEQRGQANDRAVNFVMDMVFPTVWDRAIDAPFMVEGKVWGFLDVSQILPECGFSG